MSETGNSHLEKVEQQLARYEHPLFHWTAQAVDRGIQVTVSLKYSGIHDDPYVFYLTPRELDDRAFEWDFQRQLYN